MLLRILLIVGLATALLTRTATASPAAQALVDAAGVVDSLEHGSWPKSPAVTPKRDSHDAKTPKSHVAKSPTRVHDGDGDADDSGPAPSPKSPRKHKSQDAKTPKHAGDGDGDADEPYDFSILT